MPCSKGLLPGVTQRPEEEEGESEAEIWRKSLPGRDKPPKSKEDTGGRVAADFGTMRRRVWIPARSLSSCVWPWTSPRISPGLGGRRDLCLFRCPRQRPRPPFSTHAPVGSQGAGGTRPSLPAPGSCSRHVHLCTELQQRHLVRSRPISPEVKGSLTLQLRLPLPL